MKLQNINKESSGNRYEIHSFRQEIDSIRYEINWKLQKISKDSPGYLEIAFDEKSVAVHTKSNGITEHPEDIIRKSLGNQ